MKIRDLIRQAQSYWKGAEILVKSMDQGLQKFFKVVVKKSNNQFPALGESGSYMFHFIQELRNFSEVVRLLTEIKKAW